MAAFLSVRGLLVHIRRHPLAKVSKSRFTYLDRLLLFSPYLSQMKDAYIIRKYFKTHTLGVFVAVDENQNVLMSCSILELPWLNNERRRSCIPEGVYQVKERKTARFGRHYWIQDVPERQWILQHAGNYTRQILGCQLPGQAFKKLDSDEIPDIANTRVTLDKMLALLGKEYRLTIFSAK